MKDYNGLTERMLFTTARLQVDDGAGNSGFGTGFFFGQTCLNSEGVECLRFGLFTNAHVVQKMKTMVFHVHVKDADSDSCSDLTKRLTIRVPLIPDRLNFHPDPEVDLVAIGVTDLMLHEESKSGVKSFIKILNPGTLVSDDDLARLDAVNEVLMVGYPQGVWDEKNNLPVIRRGITASHPTVDLEGRSNGMLDIAAFGGSSGSPVFLWQTGFGVDRESGAVQLQGFNLLLLGVLCQYVYHDHLGSLTALPIPTSAATMVSLSHMKLHLGIYIKAREVIQLAKLLFGNAS